MAKLLVVDDSGVDRRLMEGLLACEPDFEVHCVSSGAQALEAIRRDPPDLVLTDLVMPEMNGLELVRAVRERFPLVPLVLLTSQGNEEVAVEALQQGASSYVSKKALAQHLVETVHKVLAVSVRERSHSRLLGCVTESSSAFVLENDPELIPPLVAHLQEGLGQLNLCDEADRTRVGVALEEALSHALFHGNLAICSDLRDCDDRSYCELAAERRRKPPYSQRRIFVEVSFQPEAATFVVRDEGAGFDFAALPDPTDPANLERCSGRGILLMRTFMDSIRYNDRGNEVTLVKRCGRPEGARQSP
jgi:CheY-like chemotaxis protein